VDRFHGGVAGVCELLSRYSGIPAAELTSNLYVHYEDRAVQHLFALAAGLDSMVVGEAQILGQLRTAYAGAEQAGTVGRTLHEVAQQALRVGKRVQTETDIDAHGASVLSEGLAAATAKLAGRASSGLAGRRAMVLGAGSLGNLAAAHLRRAGVAEIVLANRTAGKAERMAALCKEEGTPARVIGLDAVSSAISAIDLVICCTGATGVVTVADVGARVRPLVVCDLGLPRNVEPAVGDVPGVTLLDLTTVDRRLEHRETPGELEAAQYLVAQEVQSYLLAQRTAEVLPTVAALRTWAADVADAELLQLDRRLPELDAGVRAEFVRTVRRVVGKLLHAPTVRVQELAKADGGATYADALRELFELDRQTPAAITAPRRSIPGFPALVGAGDGIPYPGLSQHDQEDQP
jgi:glutamyl-tRNA reductase